MSTESSFDQLIAALEEQQDKVTEDILDLRLQLAQEGYHQVILAKAHQLADRAEVALNYTRALDILAAMKGAFVEVQGTTREQDELLQQLGFITFK